MPGLAHAGLPQAAFRSAAATIGQRQIHHGASMPAYVPAAARTMTIFETFANARRELSNSEIARLLGVAESSSSDLLHTLHEVGYLLRTARTRRFYPTARLRSI